MVNSPPLVRVFLRYYPHRVTLEVRKWGRLKRACYATQCDLLGQIGWYLRLVVDQPIVNYGIPEANGDLYNQQVCHNGGN